jgi:hypothetical protein
MQSLQKREAILTSTLIVIVAFSAFLHVLTDPFQTAAAATYADSKIVRTQSGLIASDSLTTGDLSKWYLFGDAIARKAPHAGYEDKDGLHIGIIAPKENRWSGYFAISPLREAKLYHVKITLPDARPTKNMADAALYVQQEMYRDPRIDSIGCGADIFPAAIRWGVGWGSGNATTQTSHQAVYVDKNPNQPTSRECTLVTNGDNELVAYIDGEKVFSSKTMHLNMPKPFQSYLELQTNSNATSHGQMFTGTFTDYYETAGEFLTVRGAKPELVVRLTEGTTENILSSTVASANGTALLDVGRHHMPLYGSIQVLDARGENILASTEGPVGNIYGGDVFSVSGSLPAGLLSAVQPVFVANKQYNVTLQSTSPITSFKFLEDQKKITFKTDEESTKGFALVSVGGILGGPYVATVDGQPSTDLGTVDYNATRTGYLKVSYTRGPHDISIVGTRVVPEFPVAGVVLASSLATIIIIAGTRTRCKSSVHV